MSEETITKTQVQIVPEPMPLICHKLWLQTRLVDIKQAIERFNIAGKECPKAWKNEYDNLVVEIKFETVS